MEKLFGLKDVPLWLLLGFAVVSTVVWQSPPLQTGLPATVTSSLPLLSVGLGLLAGFCAASRAIQRWVASRVVKAARERERLLKVYRPIQVLFLERHVTACSAILAPRLRDRIANAREKLRGRRHLAGRVGRAVAALSDRDVHTSAEVEYGGQFPLDEIKAIARANPEHVDTKLLGLIRQADRSKYEEPGSGLLTDEEFALLNFVHDEHDRLSRRS